MEKIARECKELIAQAMQDQARGIDKIVLTPAAYAEFADLARVLAEGWAQEVRNESTRNLLRSVASNWHRRRGRPKKGEQTGLLGIPVPVEKPKKGYAGRPPLWDTERERIILTDFLRRKAEHEKSTGKIWKDKDFIRVLAKDMDPGRPLRNATRVVKAARLFSRLRSKFNQPAHPKPIKKIQKSRQK